MPEYSRPATYLGKLEFAERVAKAAQFRADPKQALRELCEAFNELVAALLDRERGHEAGAASQPPSPG
jgi:hypothetical protein